MVAFYPGAKPVFLALAFAALTPLAACSSAGSSTYTSDASYVSAPRVAAQAVKVDVEDDGLPSQTPPRMRAGDPPDDPNEPYSPNYGGENPAALPVDHRDERGKNPAPASQPPRNMRAESRETVKTALVQDE